MTTATRHEVAMPTSARRPRITMRRDPRAPESRLIATVETVPGVAFWRCWEAPLGAVPESEVRRAWREERDAFEYGQG